MNKNVLIVVANPSTHPTLGYPVGFWASELFHPIHVFNNASVNWDIVSPDGGKVEMDALSNPNDSSQYSAWDELSKRYIEDKDILVQLENTPAVGSVDLDKYDAIMVAGGQSPMFTFEKADDLQKVFKQFYESGKTTAALCHGTAILNYVKDDNGDFLVSGKKVTGFSNEEEDAANEAAGTEIMPWRIEDALTEKDADFSKAEPWQSYTVVDRHLITGQQNISGEETAKRIVEQLSAV